ncbi:MAG: GNAT family N-acetyltransferase [Vicinamibacterales bacterium]
MRSRLSIAKATADQAEAVSVLRNAVAAVLTARHGIGHWSSVSTERGVRSSMRRSAIYLVRERGTAVATFELATRKPWAIDRRYFTAVNRPLYLVGMAVDPVRQRCGIGRRCIDQATLICRTWPADALWLDAYDADAGAGEFYRKCGFTEVGRALYRNTSLIYFELLV